jgi:hypothetical protein
MGFPILPKLTGDTSVIVVSISSPLKEFLTDYLSPSEFYRMFSQSLQSVGGMSNRTFARRVIKGGYYIHSVSNGKMNIDFILMLKPNKRTEMVLAVIKMRFRKLLKSSEIIITDFEHKSNDDLRELIKLKGSGSLLQPIRETYFDNRP